MDEPTNTTKAGVLGQPTSRRSLLKYVLVAFSSMATAGGVLTPIISYLWPPKQAAAAGGGPVAVASTADLPVGKGKVYSVANKPVIVIRTTDGYHAVSAVCTHLACIVRWDEQRAVLACPCHAGFFTVNGDVISGPPPSPLTKYQVQVQGDQIYVSQGQS
jgi:cytochrome b6-f complex iron-sulfur subunit